MTLLVVGLSIVIVVQQYWLHRAEQNLMVLSAVIDNYESREQVRDATR